MEKMNSRIMHMTPSELIKPLPPIIKEITSPSQYDGKRLTVFIEHTNYTLSIQEPTYEQKAEYRLKGNFRFSFPVSYIHFKVLLVNGNQQPRLSVMKYQ